MSVLEEGFRFAPDAQAEINRIHSQQGVSVEELQDKIIKYFSRTRGISEKEPRRAPAQTVPDPGSSKKITRSDVIEYELSGGAYDVAIYYFDGDKFAKVSLDELGSAADGDSLVDEEDGSVEDEAKDDSAAGEDEETEGKEEDEDPLPAEVENRLASMTAEERAALKKTGSALVQKRIKPRDENQTREIPITTFGRYLHLLPVQATIDHIEREMRRVLVPKIDEGVDRGERSDALLSTVLPALHKLMDALQRETTLTDREIEDIEKILTQNVRNVRKPDPTSAKRQAEDFLFGPKSGFKARLRPDSSGRSDASRLIDYVTRSNRVVTPDQLMRIDSKLDITPDDIKRTSDKFSQIMRKRQIKLTLPKGELEKFMRKSGGEAAETESEGSIVGGESQIAEFLRGADISPDRAVGGVIATSGNAVESQLVDQIDKQYGGSAGQVTLPVTSFVRAKGGGVQYHMPVQLKVRSGETASSIHNRIRDLEAVSNGDNNARRGAMSAPATPASDLLREARVARKRVSDDAKEMEAQAAYEPHFLRVCQDIRGSLAVLGGLIEYISMSGQDLLLQGEKLAKRQDLLEDAEEISGAALDMTDRIAAARLADDTQRESGVIDHEIQQRSERVDTLLAKKTEGVLTQIQSEEVTRLEREIALLREERRRSTPATRNREIAAAFTRILADLNLDRKLQNADQYASVMQGDAEEGTSPARSRSRATIHLAETRREQISRIEQAIKNEGAKNARDLRVGSTMALDRARSAKQRYRESVQSTMSSLSNRAQIQMHTLRATDTIDSICLQHRIGENVRPSDIKPSFIFRTKLPEKYSPDGLRGVLEYTVLSVEKPASTKASIATLACSFPSESGIPERRTVRVPVPVIVEQLALQAKGTSLAEAKKMIGEELKFAASSVLRSLGVGMRGEGSFSFSSTEPLAPQLARMYADNDEAAASLTIRRGVEGIAAALKDFDERLKPDPNFRGSDFLSDKLIKALGFVGSLSYLVGMGRQYYASVRSAVPTDSEGNRALTSIKNATETRPSDELVRQVKTSTGLNMSDEDLATVVQDVISNLGVVASGRRDVERISQMRNEGDYTRRVLGLQIPVPARTLLDPGATVTVVPPTRSPGRVSRELFADLGVGADAFISPAFINLTAMIDAAGFEHCFLPIVDLLADDLKEDYLTFLMGRSGERLPRNERALEIAKRSIASMIARPAASREPFDAEKHTLQAHQEINALLGSRDKIPSLSRDASPKDLNETQLAGAVVRLKEDCDDRAALAVSSATGARTLYRVAPCTAVMLNLSEFTQKERLGYDILVPTAESAFRVMTAAAYRDITVGVQRGKEGRPLLTEELDRIGSLVTAMHDFYEELAAEVGEKGAAEVVAERLRARIAPDKSLKDALPEIAAALGVPSTQDDIKRAASRELEAISREMSALSVPGLKGAVGAVIDRIVRDAAGRDTKTVATRMGVDEKKMQACFDLLNEFLGSTPSVSVTPTQDLRGDPQTLITYVTSQITQSAAESAAKNLVDEYARLSATAVQSVLGAPTKEQR
jgi:hypothetical protein